MRQAITCACPIRLASSLECGSLLKEGVAKNVLRLFSCIRPSRSSFYLDQITSRLCAPQFTRGRQASRLVILKRAIMRVRTGPLAPPRDHQTGDNSQPMCSTYGLGPADELPSTSWWYLASSQRNFGRSTLIKALEYFGDRPHFRVETLFSYQVVVGLLHIYFL